MEAADDPLIAALVRASCEIAWFAGFGSEGGTSTGHVAFTGQEISPTDRSGWMSLIHPEDREGARMARSEATAAAVTVMTYRLRHRDGGYRWVEERVVPVDPQGAETRRWAGVIIDVDGRARLEEGLRQSEESLRLATSAGDIGIWDVDLMSGARRWSAELKRILGLPEATAETETLLLSLIHPDDKLAVREAHQTSFKGGDTLTFRIQRANDGTERWIESKGRAILDETGRPIRRVGTWQDVTARKQSEALLETAANQDSLTGLANRQVFNAAFGRMIDMSRSVQSRFAVVLIDIDQFKMINDTLGHEVGDFVLRRCAERLNTLCGAATVAARLGGDEFAVLMQSVDSVAELSSWAERAVAALSVPIWFDRTEIVVSSSLGAAVYPDHVRHAADLLKSADLALYASKRNGRARSSLFEPSMKAAIQRRATALQNAREALIRNDIVPFYQPKVAPGSDGVLDGFEALLRWRDDGTVKPPGALAAALDDADLSVQIGTRMIELVADDIRRWTAAGLRFGTIAVNVSGSEFAHSDIAARWLATIGRAGIAPDLLQIEVTETVFLGEKSGEVGRALDQLSRRGIKTALDDFGTGHASLTHLRTYPVDVLKIDKTFVDDIERDAGSKAIIRGLIALAHELGIRVVAEGVETPEQRAILAAEACDFIQGYLIAKPMAASRVPHFVNAWTSGRPEIRASFPAAVGDLRRLAQGR